MQPHNSQMGVKRTTPSIPAREEIFADLTFRSERRPEWDVRHWRDEQTIEDMHQRSRGAKRARGIGSSSPSITKRAQGRPGAWPTPMAPVREKMHGAGTTGLAEIHPAFPARMVLTAYSALSPVRPGFVVTVTRGTQMRPCGFSTSIGAPGPRGLTVRHIVSRLAQKRLTLRRPSHPASTFVTTRTPLLRSGMRGVAIEWVGL
jgi:hypothetical protein